ncbi:MAG: homoserine dehydrogenase [Candidatus Saganbacteria bacterium]|nr:homoserine dehydrogenase [Candidatus Saganbacteria bacterium]
MPKKINIGIIGFGNIGQALAASLLKNHDSIKKNTGIDIKIKMVCDLRKIKCRYPLTTNPYKIINDPDISVVVSCMGGVNPALKYILAALKQKKHVVTPNKEVIAKHLKKILDSARKNKVSILFEGAVGGGIPIIMPLRKGLVGNRISSVFGIVNGTTNYILSKMSEGGASFFQALKEAQLRGYAEPNPVADIKGYDAAYKAAILAAVAFGAEVNMKDVYCEGITRITQDDIQYAAQIGYVIKLLAITCLVNGKLEVRVHPALVFKNHPLASVRENFNAICVRGKPVGEVMFFGPGAGGGPTASAITSDIVAAANYSAYGGRTTPPTADKLRKIKPRKMDDISSRYYIRLEAADKPGVLAGISKAFARKKVSISAVVQKETDGKRATIVIFVHSVPQKNLMAALKIIKKLPVVQKVCNVIRIF